MVITMFLGPKQKARTVLSCCLHEFFTFTVAQGLLLCNRTSDLEREEEVREGLLLWKGSLSTFRSADSAQHSKAKPNPSVRLSLRMLHQRLVQ